MLATSAHGPFLFFFIFLHSCFVGGVLQNRTIDDQHGDSLSGAKPVFNGPGWNLKAQRCKACSLKPDLELAFGRTWTAITHHKSDPAAYVEIAFAGIEVEVFCIVPNLPPNGVIGTYDLKFTLDGQPAGEFYQEPSFRAADAFSYNVSVFRKQGLENKQHTLVLNATSTARDSVLIFDYVHYIYDDGIELPSSTSTSDPTLRPFGVNADSSPTANIGHDSGHTSKATIIAASVLAPLFLITLSLLLLLYGSRRYGWLQRKQRPNSDKLPIVESQSQSNYLPPPSTTTLSNPDNGFTIRIQRWASHVAGQRLVHPFSPPSEAPSTCRTQTSIPASTPAQRERVGGRSHERHSNPPRKQWVVCNPSSSSGDRSAR